MLLWTSDIHLNFLKPQGFASPTQYFGEYLMAENPEADGLIITGDISTGNLLYKHLKELAEGFTKPIYFVLGNHDFWGSSFSEIETNLLKALALYKTEGIDNLHWLNDGWKVHDRHAIVGVNGWYDAMYGDQMTKSYINDFYEIQELMPGTRYHDLLLQLVRDRAGQEADRLAVMLKEACEKYDKIIVCTHVPPYAESAWHMGFPSEPDMMPWFSSASTGAVLDTYSARYPEKTFVVLAGHSHSPGVFQKRDNMTVYTAKARYGVPDLAGVVYTKEQRLWAFDNHLRRIDVSYGRQVPNSSEGTQESSDDDQRSQEDTDHQES